MVQPVDPAQAGPGLAQELIAFCRAHLAHFKCPRTRRLRRRAAPPADRQAVQAAAPRQVLGRPPDRPSCAEPPAGLTILRAGGGRRRRRSRAPSSGGHGVRRVAPRSGPAWLASRRARSGPAGTATSRDTARPGRRCWAPGDGLITNVSLILGVRRGVHQRLDGPAGGRSPGCWPARSRWPPASWCRCGPSTSWSSGSCGSSGRSWRTSPRPSGASWPPCTGLAGCRPQDAETVARILSANASVALDTHARLELGIDPDAAGSAGRRAAWRRSWPSRWGALLPLLPWFFGGGTAVRRRLGRHRGGGRPGPRRRSSGSSPGGACCAPPCASWRSVRVAAGVTYGVGSLLGVSTS